MGNVIISGANRGIGLALATQFHRRGDNVIALCRTAGDALPELDITTLADVDVTRRATLDRLPDRLGEAGVERIDVLINNAGVLSRQALGEIDSEQATHMVRQFEVNALGPLLLTQALLPMLHAGAKVAVITSRMGSVGDNTSGGAYGYRMSKAAANAAGRSLAIDLAPRGVAVALLHPGWVRTDMTGGKGLIDTAESAAGMIAVLDRLSSDNSGQFWHTNGEILPW